MLFCLPVPWQAHLDVPYVMLNAKLFCDKMPVCLSKIQSTQNPVLLDMSSFLLSLLFVWFLIKPDSGIAYITFQGSSRMRSEPWYLWITTSLETSANELDQYALFYLKYTRATETDLLRYSMRKDDGKRCSFSTHCAKKPVTAMLTYPWKCTVLHCNHLGNTWKPLVLMT